MDNLANNTQSAIYDLILRYEVGDESREKIITPFLDYMYSIVYDYYFNGMSLNHIFDFSTINERGTISLETAETDHKYIENTLALALIDTSSFEHGVLAANMEFPTENQSNVSIPDSVIENASDGGVVLETILQTVFPGNTSTLLFSDGHVVTVSDTTFDWRSQYSYVADCGSDLFCVEMNGYYGCVDESGNKVIGFYYEEPLYFANDISVMRSNGKYGVVDTQGNELISPLYREIQFDGNYMRVSDYSDSWGLCNQSGEMIIPTGYMGFEYLNGSILACVSYELGKYDLYDLNGSKFSEENVTALTGYVCKSVESVSKLADDRLAVRCALSNHSYYILLDTDFNLVTAQCFTSIQPFSSLGYSVAWPGQIESRQDFGGMYYWCNSIGIYVIDKSGNLITELPSLDLGAAGSSYESVNEYYAYGSGHSGTGYSTYRYAIVNLRTKEIIEYASIEMIDGTNCIIVSDSATGRYGLYDGEGLALEIIYDSIEYMLDGTFAAQRGAEMTTYTPVLVSADVSGNEDTSGDCGDDLVSDSPKSQIEERNEEDSGRIESGGEASVGQPDLFSSTVTTPNGFAGDIAITVSVDKNKVIQELQVEHNETAGSGKKVIDDSRQRLIGVAPTDVMAEINAVTGATITSSAYLPALGDAFVMACAEADGVSAYDENAPIVGIWRWDSTEDDLYDVLWYFAQDGTAFGYAGDRGGDMSVVDAIEFCVFPMHMIQTPEY